MAAEDDDDSHIIASVRRILGEDASRPSTDPAGAAAADGDVFELQPGMMIESGHGGGSSKPGPAHSGGHVPAEDELSPDLAAWASEWGEEEPEPATGAVAPAAPVVSESRSAETTSGRPAPVPAPAEARLAETHAAEMPRVEAQATGATVDASGEPMVEARTADVAGHAFGSLRDTLREQRAASGAVTSLPAIGVSSHAGGPTVEEMIRQELRPLLKSWLDASLPTLVERMVSAEIARIVERDGA